jgi:hypothetical protein
MKKQQRSEVEDAERESIDRVNITRQALKHAFLDCQTMLEQ